MSKFIPPDLIDDMLSLAQGTHISICAGQPTNYSEVTSMALGTKALTGSYTQTASASGGRKNLLPEQQDITITTAGQANHVAIHTNSSLLLVTTCAAINLQVGDLVTTNAFAHEIQGAV